MTNRRLVILFAVTLCLIGLSYVKTNNGMPSSPPAGISIAVDGSMPVPRSKTTDELIEFWQSRVVRDPRDYISLGYLGQTFMRRARETGDIADYERAQVAFNNALELNPDYEPTLAFLGAVQYAKHDFHAALRFADRVYSFDPRALQALATIGDAQMELGNYVEAETAFRTLLDQAPGPPVYARLSRLAWLKGNSSDALKWMQKSVDEADQAGYTGEEAAWYEFQLGENYFSAGRIDEAEKHYTAALGYFNRYHFALGALGKVRAAQGRYAEAIEFYQRAVDIIPQPVYLAALGDLYTLTGDSAKTNQQYDTVDFIGKLAAINQVVYNRELVLFDANHDRKVNEALDLASKELAVRKDIYGYDAEAWALYKNGRYPEAAKDMEQAMKLNTHDALLYYHAGMIYESLGDHARARTMLTQALSINPHFDLLQSRVARVTLDQLPNARP